MKDWIIISWYDGGYDYAISIDGKVKYKQEIEDIEDLNNPYKGIWVLYDTYWDNAIEKIQAKYPKNLLVCDSGGIEIYEITQK